MAKVRIRMFAVRIVIYNDGRIESIEWKYFTGHWWAVKIGDWRTYVSREGHRVFDRNINFNE